MGNNICVNCSNITNAQGPTGPNTVCLCVSPYKWNWDGAVGTCSCDPTFEITIA
jgi:hypothetical protein